MLRLGQRNIQKLGRAQYINLPKVWTENNQTKKGDLVDIELQDDGSLNIKVASPSDANLESDAASAPQEALA